MYRKLYTTNARRNARCNTRRKIVRIDLNFDNYNACLLLRLQPMRIISI